MTSRRQIWVINICMDPDQLQEFTTSSEIQVTSDMIQWERQIKDLLCHLLCDSTDQNELLLSQRLGFIWFQRSFTIIMIHYGSVQSWAAESCFFSFTCFFLASGFLSKSGHPYTSWKLLWSCSFNWIAATCYRSCSTMLTFQKLTHLIQPKQQKTPHKTQSCRSPLTFSVTWKSHMLLNLPSPRGVPLSPGISHSSHMQIGEKGEREEPVLVMWRGLRTCSIFRSMDGVMVKRLQRATETMWKSSRAKRKLKASVCCKQTVFLTEDPLWWRNHDASFPFIFGLFYTTMLPL